MALSDLTPAAVEQALQAFDRLGREQFLSAYGFAPAKIFFIAREGRLYDARPVAGVAHGFIGARYRVLKASRIPGGETAVKLALQALGYTVVRQGQAPPTAPSEPLDYDEDMAQAVEGAEVTRLHRLRERDQALPATLKRQRLQQTGALECEACGFDFARAYGPHGLGFIEAHHTQPLHTLTEAGVTRLEDLALLCANCHRMIHRRAPWLTVEALRALLQGPGADQASPPPSGNNPRIRSGS